MGSHEGGRWDVGVKENAVYLERIADGEEQLFEDLLDPDEARALAGLLTKFADKLDESSDSGKSDDDDDDDDDEDDEVDDDDDDDDKDDDEDESDDDKSK